MAKRYTGTQACKQYDTIFFEQSSVAAADFVLGEAEIETDLGKFTTEIQSVQLILDPAPVCSSAPVEMGDGVFITITASLRKWTLINR